jgi:hypothetical protein
MNSQYVVGALDDARLDAGRGTPLTDLRIEARPARGRKRDETKTIQSRHPAPRRNLHVARKYQRKSLIENTFERQSIDPLRRPAKTDIEPAVDQALVLLLRRQVVERDLTVGGTVLAMVLSAWLIQRMGVSRSIRVSAVVYCRLANLIPLVSDVVTLAVIVLLFGAAGGTMNVAMNVLAPM